MTVIRDFFFALFWSCFAVGLGVIAATIVHPGIF